MTTGDAPSPRSDATGATRSGRQRRAHTARPTTARTAPIQIFLFSDIRDFSRFSLEHGDEAAAQLSDRFMALADESVRAHGGRIFNTAGDAVGAVFDSARRALRAAVDLQERCARERAGDPAFATGVGVGLDAGEAVAVADDFRGTSLNLASRLCGAAQPGEVLCSETVVSLASRVPGLSYRPRGLLQVKGFDEPVRVVQVAAEGAAADVTSGAQTAAKTPSPPVASAAAPPTEPAREPPVGSYLGSLPDGPLVAREAEVAQVLAALDAVSAGEGRLVLLAGEPGIGKTRLAQELTREAHARGFLIAAGRCYEPQATVAYYPFLEALTKLYAIAPPPVRDELPHRWAEVARLLPDQRVGVPAQPASAGSRDDQQQLFWQVSGFVQAVAHARPVALLLDDLHWADSATIDLVQHLVRQTHQHRVLILGTYRDDEIGRAHPLDRALRDLGREKLLQRVSLRRLSAEGTRRLISATLGDQEVSDEFTDLLHGRTEGNPFFTREVLRTLVERGDVYRERGAWERRELGEIAVPESVRAVVEQRLAHLSDETQEVLRAASVLGQSFTFTDVAGLDTRGEDAVEAALEQAIAAALVRETGREGYVFQHVLVQQTLYAELPSRKKRRLHLAAAGTIEGQADHERRAADLAYHFGAAREGARALPYALLAGDQAEAVYAHAEAEGYYRSALALARELEDRAREAEALEKLGAVLAPSNRFDEGLALLDQAFALRRAAKDTEAMVRAAAQIGWAYNAASQHAAGLKHLRELLGAQPLAARTERLEADAPGPAPESADAPDAPDGPNDMDLLAAIPASCSPRTLAQMYHALASLITWHGDYTTGLAATERAYDYARAAGDVTAQAEALRMRGITLCVVGRIEPGVAALQEALVLAEAAGERKTLGRVLQSLGEECHYHDTLERALPYYRRALEVAEQSAVPSAIINGLARLADVTTDAGMWAETHTCLDRLDVLLREPGTSSAMLVYFWGVRGALSLAEGRRAEADADLERAVERARREGAVLWTTYAQLLLAERDILDGRPQEARRRVEPFLALRGKKDDFDIPRLLAVAAWAALEQGDEEQAQAWLDDVLGWALGERHFWSLFYAWRVLALMAIRHERWEVAEYAAEQVLPLTRRGPFPAEEIKARYTRGLVHAARGEGERAREEYRVALSICDRLGEGLYRPHIERALADLEQQQASSDAASQRAASSEG